MQWSDFQKRFAIDTASAHFDTGLSCICVTGKNAKAFLQGQLTCNMDTLVPAQLLMAAHANQQGRMESLGYVCAYQDGFMYLVPQSIALHAYTTLNKYAPFSRVQLEQLPNSLTAVLGPEANSELPYESWCLPGPLPHYLVLNTTSHENLYSKTIWQYFNIMQGISFLTLSSIGLFLPHEINLMQLGGLSLEKGCFIGQEVIARMHYLGKLKKHLWLVELQGDWQPGDLLMQNGKTIGQLVCASHEMGLAIINDEVESAFEQGSRQGKKLTLATALLHQS